MIWSLASRVLQSQSVPFGQTISLPSRIAHAQLIVRRSWTKFADSPLEEAVSSEPVSGPPISLLAGKLQGISSDSGVQRHILSAKQQQNQGLTGQFPTRFNREFFGGLQGIESGQQGNFSTDQGLLLCFETSARADVPVRRKQEHLSSTTRRRGPHQAAATRAGTDPEGLTQPPNHYKINGREHPIT